MALLLLPWNAFPDISEYPKLIITRPTQQPNIRIGEGLVMEVAVLHYQGPLETLTLQLSGGGTLPPISVTVTNVTPPFQILWSEFSPAFEHSISSRATLPDGRVLIAQQMRLRLPNAVEVIAPTQASVFIAPIDIRYLMFVENVGPTNVRLLANPDQVLANLWISFSPPGLVSDVMDHTIRNVPPGHYEVHAVLGDFPSSSGVLLPGAVSPSVSFVVLDRHTAADLDRDGLPDLWEIRHGLDPARPDADEDADNDGLSNFHEMLAGTGGLKGFRLPLDPHTSSRFYRVAIVR